MKLWLKGKRIFEEETESEVNIMYSHKIRCKNVMLHSYVVKKGSSISLANGCMLMIYQKQNVLYP